VITIGALAMGALTACRSEAGTAAFVGNTRITEKYVNSLIASVPPTANLTGDVATEFAITYATYNAFFAKFAEAKGYATAKPDPTDLDSLATQLKVPQSNPLVQAIAQYHAWANLLDSKAPSATLTDADFDQLIIDLQADGNVLQAGQPLPTHAQLLTIPGINQAVGLQRQLMAFAKTTDVTINPRYEAACTAAQLAKAPCGGVSSIALLQFPLQSGDVASAVYLGITPGDKTPPVIDLPTAPASASAAAGS
jgi:hypothetical protein